jgi:hypothetical protein
MASYVTLSWFEKIIVPVSKPKMSTLLMEVSGRTPVLAMTRHQKSRHHKELNRPKPAIEIPPRELPSEVRLARTPKQYLAYPISIFYVDLAKAKAPAVGPIKCSMGDSVETKFVQAAKQIQVMEAPWQTVSTSVRIPRNRSVAETTQPVAVIDLTNDS